MDIDLLSKMVKELILDSDVVTLPGVGSFVAELVPSTFSDRGYTINPPYRRLSFRPREEGDSLLVDLYAKSNKLDFGTADSLMRSYLSEMKDLLKDKKTIVFPGLGRLRATRENNFFFIADEDLNIYPDGFGLQPVSLKTHVETDDEVSAAVAELRSFLDDDPKDEAVPQPVMEPVGPSEEELAAQKAEEERLAKELAETEEAERLAREQAEKEEAERLAKEQAEREEAERLAKEAAEKEAAEKEAAEKAAEAERIAAARAEAQRIAEENEREQKARAKEEKRLQALKKEAAARKRMEVARKVWKVTKRIGAVAAVLALLVGAYMALGRIAPDFVDRFLYSEQELEILHHTFTLNL
ncbi:MAG: hypothetical protein MJY83_01175 [Bacteroidales bacterium]|nr:hypothetical protein [Bacteroidales bacterium]